MPFGKWDSHNSCVDDMMSNQGYDEETAHRVCAWLEYEITGSWPSEKDFKKGEKDMPRKNEESFEGYISKIQRELNKKYPNEYIIATFGDAVIVDSMQEVGTPKYYEVPYKINNEEIEFGEHKEVAMGYVEKRIKSGEKVIMSQTELSGPIFKKEEKQRIVYAAVLVPGEPDYDYEKGEKILTAEEIEYVAHKWMEDYGNIDYMHGMNNVAKPVETFILPFDWEVEFSGKKTNLPKGTWVLAGKVTNDQAWKEVEDGKLTGFSIMGIQNTVLKDILKDAAEDKQVGKSFEAAMKRTMLKDLGDNWIVPFVSLVDEPCVPKAKFFAIKAKEKEVEKEKKENSVWNKLVAFFKKDDDFDQLNETVNKMSNMVEKAGRSISEDTYKELKSIYEALSKLMAKADKERKPKFMKSKNLKGDEIDMEVKDVEKMIEEKLDAKLEPILKALTREDENAEKKQEEKEETATKKAEKETEENNEVEKLKNENSNYQKIIETLKAEKAKLEEEKTGKTKSEKGQDDNQPEPYTVTKMYQELKRDAYGRAIKEEEL